MTTPQQFLKYIDDHAMNFVERLAGAVRIKSVSGDTSIRSNVVAMASLLKKELEAVDATVVLKELGKQVIDGKVTEFDLPPVIFASVGNDIKKKTVLCYGHYDVQPALKADGWITEDPFVLDYNKQNPEKLIGRGATDDKGPIMGWVNVLEAHKKTGLTLPVNLKFCFEGMEENGSDGLEKLIIEEVASGTFFKGVDAVCLTDSYWLNTRTPVLTYGLRGISYYNITVEGLAFDLHSGAFGGMVYEPLTDLIAVMSRLVASDGTILIPGVRELVPDPTSEEIKEYEKLDYTMQDFKSSIGEKTPGNASANSVTDNTVALLLKRMRLPSLSLHGIRGAADGKESKTVIPSKVIGKFSLRLVQNQTPDKIDGLVRSYIEAQFKTLGSKNKLSVTRTGDGLPWKDNYKHWNYVAAANATKAVYNKEPDVNREGGSIPIALTFSEQLKVNVLLLPMGRGDDGEHSVNEKIDFENYTRGTKLFGTYLYEIARLAHH